METELVKNVMESSPFVDGSPITEFYTVQEKYSEEKAKKLKEPFNDKKLMKTILAKYKIIYAEKIKQEEKMLEILKEVIRLKHMKQVNHSVLAIPVFLDCCYIYYLNQFDTNALIFKLPKTLWKFDMFLSACGGEKDSAIYNAFKSIIEDDEISELRADDPPYNLMTFRTIDETEKLIDNKKDKFNTLLECVMKL